MVNLYSMTHPILFLVHQGWKLFENTVRWRQFFKDKTSSTPYLRRFYVRTNKEAPNGDEVFERGLEKGKDLLFEKTAALDLNSKQRFNLNFIRIRQELQSRELLVLATDKNLGIAVVTRDW
jgi:hypothetical protein